MFKNTASQVLTLYAVDASTGLPKTADSANMVFYISKDDGSVTAITSNSGVPTEVDSTNAKGLYKIALAQAETNGDKLLFSGKSSTSNIVVVPTVIYTTVQITGDAYARLGAPAGSSVSADIALTAKTTDLLSAAAVASAIWQDLLSSSDFSTSGSIGALLKTLAAIESDANSVSYDIKGVLRLLLAASFNIISGAVPSSSCTVDLKALNPTKNRAIMTLDANGNNTAVSSIDVT